MLTTPPIPLPDILNALNTLTTCLIDHQPVDPNQFDTACTTLSRARDQLGGQTRQLITTLFTAAAPNTNPAQLTDTLHALNQLLPQPPQPPDNTGPGQQLTLFPVSDPAA